VLPRNGELKTSLSKYKKQKLSRSCRLQNHWAILQLARRK